MKSRTMALVLFSFLLALTLFADSIIILVRYGLLREDALARQLNTSTILIQNTENSVMNSLRSFTEEIGLPQEILEGVFEPDVIRDDSRRLLLDKLDRSSMTQKTIDDSGHTDYTEHTEYIEYPEHSATTLEQENSPAKERLAQQLREVLSLEEGRIEEDIEAIIEGYLDSITVLYRDALDTRETEAFIVARETFFQYGPGILAGLLVVTALLLCLLLLLQRSSKRGWSYLGYSTGGTAVLMLLSVFAGLHIGQDPGLLSAYGGLESYLFMLPEFDRLWLLGGIYWFLLTIVLYFCSFLKNHKIPKSSRMP